MVKDNREGTKRKKKPKSGKGPEIEQSNEKKRWERNNCSTRDSTRQRESGGLMKRRGGGDDCGVFKDCVRVWREGVKKLFVIWSRIKSSVFLISVWLFSTHTTPTLTHIHPPRVRADDAHSNPTHTWDTQTHDWFYKIQVNPGTDALTGNMFLLREHQILCVCVCVLQ